MLLGSWEISGGEAAGGDADVFAEEAAERSETFKADRGADFGDRKAFGQQLLGAVEAQAGDVGVWALAEGCGKDAVEMIGGQTRGARGGLERDWAVSLGMEELASTRGPAQHFGSGGSSRGGDAGHLAARFLVAEQEAAREDQVTLLDLLLRRLGDASPAKFQQGGDYAVVPGMEARNECQRGSGATGVIEQMRVRLDEAACDIFHESALEKNAASGDGLGSVDVHGVGLAVIQDQKSGVVDVNIAAFSSPADGAVEDGFDGERSWEIVDGVMPAARGEEEVAGAKVADAGDDVGRAGAHSPC